MKLQAFLVLAVIAFVAAKPTGEIELVKPDVKIVSDETAIVPVVPVDAEADEIKLRSCFGGLAGAGLGANPNRGRRSVDETAVATAEDTVADENESELDEQFLRLCGLARRRRTTTTTTTVAPAAAMMG